MTPLPFAVIMGANNSTFEVLREYVTATKAGRFACSSPGALQQKLRCSLAAPRMAEKFLEVITGEGVCEALMPFSKRPAS